MRRGSGVPSTLPVSPLRATRLLCGSTRLLSRWTLALIQIWASEVHASSFVHCRVPKIWEDDVLSHGSRPSSDGAGLPRLRERRAYWQVETNIAHMFNLGKCSILPSGSGFFIPPMNERGLSIPVSVKSAMAILKGITYS